MVVLFLNTFLFVATIGKVFSLNIFCGSENEVDTRQSKDILFANIVTRVLKDTEPAHVIRAKPHEFVSAAKIFFAMALANGLINQPEQVTHFTNDITIHQKSKTSNSENAIVRDLKRYLEPGKVRRRLNRLSSIYVDSFNFINSIGFAMEIMQKSLGHNRNIADSFYTSYMIRPAYVSKSQMQVLGCEFDDVEDIKVLRLLTKNDASLKQKYDFVPIKDFSGDTPDTNLAFFFDDLKEICASVFESTTYNDVDQLIR